MTPEEFKIEWNNHISGDLDKIFDEDSRLITCSFETSNLELLSPKSQYFLTQVGLPKYGIPFTTFDLDKGIPTLSEYYHGNIPEAETPRLQSFLVLGSDGAGNPICIDLNNEEAIFMLDHEDYFKTKTFAASSLLILAQAILLGNTLSFSDFLVQLNKIDPEAASGFIVQEFEMFLDEE